MQLQSLLLLWHIFSLYLLESLEIQYEWWEKGDDCNPDLNGRSVSFLLSWEAFSEVRSKVQPWFHESKELCFSQTEKEERLLFVRSEGWSAAVALDLLHLCLLYIQNLWNSAGLTIWFLTVTLMVDVFSILLSLDKATMSWLFQKSSISGRWMPQCPRSLP